MVEDATSELRAGASTTLLLSVAAAAVSLVAVFGKDGAFTPLTALAVLAGLVPYALVVAGITVPPWLFALLAVPPGLAVVVVDGNAGGMFPLMVALMWLTLTARSLVEPVLTAVASSAAIIALTLEEGSIDESGCLYFLGGLGFSWLAGMMLRRQEALTRQLADMRDAQVERLAATERARIAREVHDVVAHSLTVVMLNLTGARRALAADPARADEALARAEVVGRDSLDAIRQVMGLLREPVPGSSLPQPSLAGVPRLIDGFRAAGLTVEVAAAGDAALVDDTVELVVYRLVQESLANVLQHAPGAAASVRLACARGGLEIAVRNGMPAAPPPRQPARTGLGTQGMAERVRAVGGSFTAGPDGAGGWLVSAWVPARVLPDDERVPDVAAPVRRR